ncbi:complex I subunit 5 family protein [Fusibacter sp. JL216-2]|uniref:complex I subunit 5 family protein n=1 Tax=Fusibacter sp. JL216-2 TaxID=3071453 RepID=UPI003D345A9A
MVNMALGLIFIPMILAILIYLLDTRMVNRLSLLIQPVLLAMTLYLVYKLFFNGGVYFVLGGWDRGVGIPLRVDQKSLIFMVMTVIGVTYFISFDWTAHRDDHKYLFFILFLQGSLMALFQAADIFTLFILLELITILAGILITYEKEGISVKAGLYYLLINSVGMTIYLMGVILLYNSVGVLDMGLIQEAVGSGPMTALQCAALGCFITAFAVKTAMFPVSSWLPLAHGSAPTQMSALLSGLLVKLGIYSLMRFMEIFSSQAYLHLILVLGVSTAIFGVGMAMLQSDIKLILAYHTVSQMGLIIMGLASGKYEGFVGSLLHDVNHFLFKSLLFLGSGVVIYLYGSRDVRQIRGVLKNQPVIGYALLIGVLGITGAPLFDGSLSKILIEESFIGRIGYFIILFVNLGTILSFMKFSQIFFGYTDRQVKIPVNRWKKNTVVVMALVMLVTYPLELIYFDGPWTEVHFTTKSLLKGAAEFALLFGVAYILLKRVLKPLLVKYPNLGKHRLGFQEANSMVLIFLGSLWGYFLYLVP